MCEGRLSSAGAPAQSRNIDPTLSCLQVKASEGSWSPSAPVDHLRCLHGSFNWRSADGRNVLVVGTDKTAQIASLPLLSWYTDVFRDVVSAGDVRLMIAGYGFGDEHVNATIADPIENHVGIVDYPLYVTRTHSSNVKSRQSM